MVLSDALEISAAIKGIGKDFACGKDDKVEIRTKCLLSLDEWKLIVGSYEPSWLMVSVCVCVCLCVCLRVCVVCVCCCACVCVCAFVFDS